MADRITLKLQLRETLGKKVKALRRAGITPVHLYGSGTSPRSLQCQSQELVKVLTRAGGNTAVSITIDGESDEHLAFVREIQWNPIRGDLFHVDFLRTEATQLVSAEVPVALIGDSPGARQISGTVVQQLRTISVEALPLDMPQDIQVDLSVLTEPDGVIRAGDIPMPSNATLLTDANEVIARIEAARVEEVRVEGAISEEAGAGDEETPAESQEGES